MTKPGTTDASGETQRRPQTPVQAGGQDPTDTDHPVGAEQAAENGATESPS